MTDTELTLPERILLLVLTDRGGSLLQATDFRFSLAGAILAELIRHGRVEMKPGSSIHPLVTVVLEEATGDPVLDDALGQLLRATRRATAKRWIGRFAEDDQELDFRAARQLCRKGVLDEHEGRVRLIFRRTVYADLDPEAERRVTGMVREAVLGDDPVDARTAVLTALADAGRILSHIVDPDDLLERHERLRTLIRPETLTEETRDDFGGAQGEIVGATRAAVTEARVAPTS